MTQSLSEKLEQGPMFDMAIVEHHFAPYMRDYDIIVEASVAILGGQNSYLEGRYRYRFSHCVLSEVTTALDDDVWRLSWGEAFIDYDRWQADGEPDGYVWGICEMDAYPGLRYVANSVVAQRWSERLGCSMYEVLVETNAHNIRLVFHDVMITKIAFGTPESAGLIPVTEEGGTAC